MRAAVVQVASTAANVCVNRSASSIFLLAALQTLLQLSYFSRRPHAPPFAEVKWQLTC